MPSRRCTSWIGEAEDFLGPLKAPDGALRHLLRALTRLFFRPHMEAFYRGPLALKPGDHPQAGEDGGGARGGVGLGFRV